ncbi:acyl-CoA thioesterase [Rhodococcus koreensis]
MHTHHAGWKTSIELRARDFDYLGHLTSAAYIELLEEARVRWLTPTSDDGQPAYVVARQSVDYRREIRPPDGPVVISIRAQQESESRIVVHEVIAGHDGSVRASCEGVLVGWDREQRCSRPLNAAERALLGRMADTDQRSSRP